MKVIFILFYYMIQYNQACIINSEIQIRECPQFLYNRPYVLVHFAFLMQITVNGFNADDSILKVQIKS